MNIINRVSRFFSKVQGVQIFYGGGRAFSIAFGRVEISEEKLRFRFIRNPNLG